MSAILPLEPSISNRRPAQVVRVVTEGVSERIYLEEVSRFPDTPIFRPYDAKGGDLQNLRKKVRDRLGNGPGAVVMDLDRSDPEDLRDFRRWCEDRGIMLILSNPSFEVWLLMHLEDVPQYMGQRDLEHELTRCLGTGYCKGKGIRPKNVMLESAVMRARLRICNVEDPFEFVLENPGTTMMHLLFE